jgi:hypothetical protein
MSVIITFSRFFEQNLFSLFKGWAYKLPFIRANPSIKKSHSSYILMKLIKCWPKLGHEHEQLSPKEGKAFLAKLKSVVEELEATDRGHGGEGAPMGLHLEFGWARVLAEKRVADADKSPQSAQTALVCWQKVAAIAEEVIIHLRKYEVAEAEAEGDLSTAVKTETPEKNTLPLTPPSSAQQGGPSSAASNAGPSATPPTPTTITFHRRSSPPAVTSNARQSDSTSRPKLAAMIPKVEPSSSRVSFAITPKTEIKAEVKQSPSRGAAIVTPNNEEETKAQPSSGHSAGLVTPEGKSKVERTPPKSSKNAKRKRTPPASSVSFLDSINSLVSNECHPVFPGRNVKRVRTEASRRGLIR